jgi:hypothetical protein
VERARLLDPRILNDDDDDDDVVDADADEDNDDDDDDTDDDDDRRSRELKRKEYRRLATLVERARLLDPRILKAQEDERRRRVIYNL